jgi:hypothetical protein
LTSASLLAAEQIFAGEIRLDGDRAHVHERAVQAIDRVHEHGILVNFLLLDFDETLADGFDVADAREKCCCNAAMRPSDAVVLPSFWRVAAMKTRGVVVFIYS